MYVFDIVVIQMYILQRVLLRDRGETTGLPSISGKELEYRVDDAAANSSTGAETFASQHLDVWVADKRAHLIHQQLTGPSVIV